MWKGLGVMSALRATTTLTGSTQRAVNSVSALASVISATAPPGVVYRY